MLACRASSNSVRCGGYGAGPGPYLVLPILGPSNLRDGVGILVDATIYGWVYGTAFDFDNHVGAAAGFYTISAINRRHNIDFRYYQTGSPFEYNLVRYLYTQKRKIEIGN